MPPHSFDDGTLGIYIHWPFCLAKCPYCDFNSHVARQVDHRRWSEALAAELRASRALSGPRRVSTVFFGGGTPSLMPATVVGRLLDEIARLWACDSDIEVTLEANPTSVEAASFAAFRHAGVNRVSIGIQSLRDEDLRRLGRMHSAEEAVRAIGIGQGIFDRVNIDLIYARQWQAESAWEAELRQAIAFGTDHLSLYQLTVEEGTPFAALDRAGKLRGLPDEDLSANLFEMTQAICESEGLPAYEVSNHARVGRHCRHNLRYWLAQDVIGIGPGAHGRLSVEAGRLAEASERDPATWLARIDSRGSAVQRRLQDPEEVADEHLLMGMRSSRGISLSLRARLRGRPANAESLAELVDLGLIEIRADQAVATAAGRLVLNEVTRRMAG